MSRAIRLASLIVLVLVLSPVAAHAAALGSLGPSPESSTTCVSEADVAGCGRARMMDETESLASDGGRTYSSTSGSDPGLAVFNRDARSGQLTQLAGREGCWTSDGRDSQGDDTCSDARALGSGDGHGIALTHKALYVVGRQHDSVVVFNRTKYLQGDPGGIEVESLSQMDGKDGCITRDGSSEDGPGTCADGRGLDQPTSISLSPDEQNVYVAQDGGSVSLVIFARDASGKLTQLPGRAGCVSRDGASEDGPGTCTTSRFAGGGSAPVFSPDGSRAYVTSPDTGGVLVYDRAADGSLTQRSGEGSCITDDGRDANGATTCGDGRGLAHAHALRFAPDHSTLYVAGDDVAVLRVDPATGLLTEPDGRDSCLSPDGSSDEGPDSCRVLRGAGGRLDVATDHDDETMYVTSDASPGAIGVVSVDPTTGLLSQLPGRDGCVGKTSRGAGDLSPEGTCTTSPLLDDLRDVWVAPEESFVYAAAQHSPGGIVVLRREARPTCIPSFAQVVSGVTVTVPMYCGDPNVEQLVSRRVVSQPADGTLGTTDPAVGVPYTSNAGFAGRDLFTYTATDGISVSTPATATVEVLAAPTPPQPARDVRAPTCTLAAPSRIRKGKLTVATTCSEAATIRATLALSRTTAKRARLATTLARATLRVTRAAAPRRLTFTLSKTTARRLSRLTTRKLRALRPTLGVTATDAAGNRRTTKKTVTLSR